MNTKKTFHTIKAIIIDSGRGMRHLDSSESYPTALLRDRRGKRVLDWTLSALEQNGIREVVFVGGYHIEKVVQYYPELHFHYNPEWKMGNDAQALSLVSQELDCPCVIILSDFVFRAEVLRSMFDAKADIVVGALNGERAPVIACLSDNATARLKNWYAGSSAAAIPEGRSGLADLLLGIGLPHFSLELGNDCARIDTPQSLSRFIFGTKAQTLERLKPLVTHAAILDQIKFTAGEWHDGPDKVMGRIRERFSQGKLIVRSSALNEDSWSNSQAGRFSSVLGIDAGSVESVRDAVDSVIGSFEKNGSSEAYDEVFVQPYLSNVSLSGVLFTKDPETDAPYIVVNYDNTSERTDTVTSGQGEDLRTTVIYKQCPFEDISHPHMAHLTSVVAELEELIGHDSLDIEFAFDREGRCYVLQVRVLATGNRVMSVVDEDFHGELGLLKEYIKDITSPSPNLFGERTILANMPDWNPAEIIGVCPRPLALSLFQHIITDRVWGQARAASGYRDTYPEPLVVSLAGHPYVDTRASFNSFIPAGLDEEIAQKLVNHYMNLLENRPELHDKVEFDVTLNCLCFDFYRHSCRLKENGFPKNEIEQIRKSLLALTDDIVCGRIAPIEKQMTQVDKLAARRRKAVDGKRNSPLSYARTIDFLLSDCIMLGTLPFSIVARYAFIASSFLKSLTARKVFTAKEGGLLAQSIPTVATDILTDLNGLHRGSLDRGAFLEKYGHLRPGTYDITCPCYREAPEYYLGKSGTAQSEGAIERSLNAGAMLFAERSSAIDALIQEVGFSFSTSELWNFIAVAIASREKAKFEYTKNLCETLAIIAEFGTLNSLSREDISFLPIQEILNLATESQSTDLKQRLARMVTLNRKRYSLNQSVKLPHIITSYKDVNCFDLLKWHPNYITSSRVVGEVVNTDRMDGQGSLDDKILLIESADPGYDWVFGRGIKGLVTKYGGAASHMAIRAAELSLPAAIGCGGLIYDKVLKAQVIEMDCAGQSIRVIR
jgi:CTP:molybdopterin cytidylyltransferase MocA/phosphohistidine swiveling domain-containing protein